MGAGHAEVCAATATATGTRAGLESGLPASIELAAKAEDLRRQLAEIEDEAKAGAGGMNQRGRHAISSKGNV